MNARVRNKARAFSHMTFMIHVRKLSISLLQVQTIPLPSPGVPSGGVGGCASIGSTLTEGYPQLSANERFLVLPCYSTATSGSATSSGARSVVRIDTLGAVDSSTTFSGASGENFRSVTSLDGSAYWLSTSNGLKFVNHSWAGTAAVQLSSSSGSSIRGTTISASEGGWWATLASTPAGVVRVPLPLPITAGSVALSASSVAGVAAGVTSATSVVVESSTSVYVSSFNSGPLHKSVRADAGSAWAPAAGFPKTTLSCSWAAGSQSFTALRGMVGRTMDGVFTLFATTGTSAGANYLVRFNTVTETCSIIAQAAANTGELVWLDGGSGRCAQARTAHTRPRSAPENQVVTYLPPVAPSD